MKICLTYRDNNNGNCTKGDMNNCNNAIETIIIVIILY